MNREVIKLQEEIKRDVKQIRILATAGQIGCVVGIALTIIMILV